MSKIVTTYESGTPGTSGIAGRVEQFVTDDRKFIVQDNDGVIFDSSTGGGGGGDISGTGTTNFITKFTNSTTVGDSQIFDNGTNVGIGTTSPNAKLDIFGDILVNGLTVGRGAGDDNRNTVLGLNALAANTSGITNTAIGRDALQNNTTGSNNTAVGANSLRFTTTGGNNTAVGLAALQTNTTGGFNTAIGRDALFNNTGGQSNTAIGYEALKANTTANNNTAIGRDVLLSNTAGDNTSVGGSSLRSNTTGGSNTAIGRSTLQFNTTGSNNCAMGRDALVFNTTGGNNIAIGLDAGRRISAGGNHSITNNSIFIGRDTRALDNNQTNQIVIGHEARGIGSNSVVLGHTNITQTQLRGNVICGNQTALATNATTGFLYIPTCDGVPTGTPTSITGKVAMVADTSNNKLYLYLGNAWVAIN